MERHRRQVEKLRFHYVPPLYMVEACPNHGSQARLAPNKTIPPPSVPSTHTLPSGAHDGTNDVTADCQGHIACPQKDAIARAAKSRRGARKPLHAATPLFYPSRTPRFPSMQYVRTYVRTCVRGGLTFMNSNRREMKPAWSGRTLRPVRHFNG